MNVVIPIHTFNLEKSLSNLKSSSISKEDLKDIALFFHEASIGKVNKGKIITSSTLTKYIFTLKVALEFFNKPTSKLTLKDVEALEKALSSNTLKTSSGKPFSAWSKSNIKMDLKVYLKWKLGDKATRLVGWLDTRKPMKTPDYLSEEQISKLFRACKSNAERFLIAVLFDSGARAEEFHNIRFEDIQFPKSSDNYIKLTLKEEYSKTKGRVISLYWLNSYSAVKDFYDERLKDGVKLSDPIFNNAYDNTRQILNRLGFRVLNRNIHYHLFRHSSATYYASKLNRQELCYRFGWAFSSNMPDVYISRAGMLNKSLDEKFSSQAISEIQSINEKKLSQLQIQIDHLKSLLQTSISTGRQVLKKATSMAKP